MSDVDRRGACLLRAVILFGERTEAPKLTPKSRYHDLIPVAFLPWPIRTASNPFPVRQGEDLKRGRDLYTVDSRVTAHTDVACHF